MGAKRRSRRRATANRYFLPAAAGGATYRRQAARRRVSDGPLRGGFACGTGGFGKTGDAIVASILGSAPPRCTSVRTISLIGSASSSDSGLEFGAISCSGAT